MGICKYYSLGLFYLFVYLGFIVVQEMYVENCTYRGGIFNMVMNLPVCNHLLYILDFLGKYFVTLMLTSTTLILGLTK